MKEEEREALFKEVLAESRMGWCCIVLSPEEISHNMLQPSKYNLNTMSHDAAIDLIKLTQGRGVELKEVYVDTVGDPVTYETMLTDRFPGIRISVRKKADSLFPCVSAASICAKVIRDHRLRDWRFREKRLQPTRSFGSGYPGDGPTKQWLQDNADYVFGYPSIVRFSWQTAKVVLEADAALVDWEDEPETDVSGNMLPANQKSMDAFFGAAGAAAGGRKRHKPSSYLRARSIANTKVVPAA